MAPAVSRRCQVQRVAGSRLTVEAKKKVNAYDEAWKKSFFGFGYFAENSEDSAVPLFKKVETKKILSRVEKSGILSALEKLGFSLSKIEKLGLLSKAESLGALGLLESLATTPPAALASLALPLVVGAIAVPILVPDDNTVLLVGQYAVAAALGAAGLTSFAASLVLAALEEE